MSIEVNQLTVKTSLARKPDNQALASAQSVVNPRQCAERFKAVMAEQLSGPHFEIRER